MPNDKESDLLKSSHLSQWINYEKDFSEKWYESWSKDYLVKSLVQSSNQPSVLLCAQHATNHYQEGLPKKADRGTGGLALTLGDRSSAGYIIKTSNEDALNGDPQSLKRMLLLAKPDLLIDIHGMREHKESDLDIGLGKNPNKMSLDAIAMLKEILADTEIRVTVNQVFKASNPKTLTTWAQRNSMAAFQIEIGANIRPPEGRTENMDALISGFLTFLKEMERYR